MSQPISPGAALDFEDRIMREGVPELLDTRSEIESLMGAPTYDMDWAERQGTQVRSVRGAPRRKTPGLRPNTSGMAIRKRK